jgi:hypothetical protein
MKLAVFVGGAAEMIHHFRTHGALRRNHEAKIMFQGFLKKKAPGLAIFLGKFGKPVVETNIHFQTDLFCKSFGHRLPFPEPVYMFGHTCV